MNRLAGRRLFIWGVFACFLAMAGWMFPALGTKPITLGQATFETDADGNTFAIVPVMNRSPYFYGFRFKRDRDDVPCTYHQQGLSAQTQWIGTATLARPVDTWPRPMRARETIYLRVRIPTNAPIIASFEFLPALTYDHQRSVHWRLRKAGERLGVLTENLIVRTHPLAPP